MRRRRSFSENMPIPIQARTTYNEIRIGRILSPQYILPDIPIKPYYRYHDQLVELLGEDALEFLLRELFLALSVTMSSGITPADVHFSKQLGRNLLPVGYPYEISVSSTNPIVYRAERPEASKYPDILKPVFALITSGKQLSFTPRNKLQKLSRTEEMMIARGIARRLPIPTLEKVIQMTTED